MPRTLIPVLSLFFTLTVRSQSLDVKGPHGGQLEIEKHSTESPLTASVKAHGLDADGKEQETFQIRIEDREARARLAATRFATLV